MFWNEDELMHRIQDNREEYIRRERVYIDAVLAMCSMVKCKPSCPFFSIKVQKKACTHDAIWDFVRQEAKRRQDEKLAKMNRGAATK